MNPKITHLKRATAVTVVAALVLCQGYVTGTPLSQVVSKVRNYVVGTNTAMPRAGVTKLPNMAQLSSSGAVTLNGMNAPNGATVFSGSGVKTTETSTATLSLGATQVALAQASDFTLAVEGTTLGGQLRAGRVNIVAPAGVAVKIMTADGPVVADGKEATNLTIDVTNGKTFVKSNRSLISQATQDGVVRDRTVSQDIDVNAVVVKSKRVVESAKKMLDEARRGRDIIKANCVNHKLMEMNTNLRNLEQRAKALKDAKAANDQDKANDEMTGIKMLSQKMDQLNSEAVSTCFEEQSPHQGSSNVSDPSMPTDPPPAPPTEADNGGDGPGLKDTLQVMASVAGVVLGIKTLEEVKKQNTLSPIAPGTGS